MERHQGQRSDDGVQIAKGLFADSRRGRFLMIGGSVALIAGEFDCQRQELRGDRLARVSFDLVKRPPSEPLHADSDTKSIAASFLSALSSPISDSYPHSFEA